MRFQFLRFLSICGFLLWSFAAQSLYAAQFELNMDDWARPRNGQTIIEFKALQHVVEAWSAAPAGSVIEIRYPGGEEGGLSAGELADWLTSFGVPSHRIQLAAGSPQRDKIFLAVVKSSGY